MLYIANGKTLLTCICIIWIVGRTSTSVEENADVATEGVLWMYSISESEKRSVPDPTHFFGTEKLLFKKFPHDAMNAYCNLLVEKNGFVNQHPNKPLSSTTFQDSETGN